MAGGLTDEQVLQDMFEVGEIEDKSGWTITRHVVSLSAFRDYQGFRGWAIYAKKDKHPFAKMIYSDKWRLLAHGTYPVTWIAAQLPAKFLYIWNNWHNSTEEFHLGPGCFETVA